MVHEVRRAREHERRRRRTADAGGGIGEGDAASFRLNEQSRLELDHTVLDHPLHRQRVLAGAPAQRPLVRAGRRHDEGETAGLVGAQAHHEHLIGMAGEHLPRESHATGPEARRRDRAVQVELPTVLRNRRRVDLEIQTQVAERLIRALSHRRAHEVHLREVLGFPLPMRVEQLADRRQVARCTSSSVVVWLARPHARLVELDPVVHRPTEFHGAEPAIPHRQRLDPLRRGRVVPEGKWLRGALRTAVRRDEDERSDRSAGGCSDSHATPFVGTGERQSSAASARV